MFGYLAGFCVYTFAMIGIILVGFVIAKRCMYGSASAKNKDKFLEVENALVIEPKKTIYVLKAGSEKFLIASDAERTSFLTKLEDNSSVYGLSDKKISQTASKDDNNQNIRRNSELDSYMAASNYSNQKKSREDDIRSNVMNRLLERLR